MTARSDVLVMVTAAFRLKILCHVLWKSARKYAKIKRQENIKQSIRDYFSRFDNISVLYVNAFESDKERTTGGLVLEDGRTFQFVYQNGEISYEEEKND